MKKYSKPIRIGLILFHKHAVYKDLLSFKIRTNKLKALKSFCMLLILALPICSFAQNPNMQYNPLQVGEVIPADLWNISLQVVNHPESSETIRLSDYRDRKIIILDFWSSWCSSCINSFPSLDSLQNIFKEDLQILLVNPASSKDDANRILYIMEKRGKIENNEGKFSVPSIYNDEILTQYFRPKVYPRLIWLNQKGEILAITGKKELSSKRLAELMEGGGRYAN